LEAAFARLLPIPYRHRRALWAMPKNAHAQLYVTEVPGDNGGVVDKYDAKTGAAISPSFITGLNDPQWLAVKGNTLFVANAGGNTVGKYDATTGAAISPSFITGMGFPLGLAVLGNKLFVVDFASGTVGKYDATTGEAINANFITGLQFPTGLAVKSAR
jgi:DNA-binding beta-propeller fold protein YncE